MYKKVLYNIKKIIKMWGGGGGVRDGQYLNPKHYALKKKKNKKSKKKCDRAGIRTHDVRVRKTCSLIH